MLPEAYRTGIPYGGGSTGLESVDHFRTNGLVCASFVSYYLWNFLPRNGVNTQMLTENFTGNYASVPEIRGVLEAASKNYAYYDTVKEASCVSSSERSGRWQMPSPEICCSTE